MSSRTTVISVCYNSTDVLSAMLASLPEDVSVILVDNASQDVPAMEKLAQAHKATLILNKENKGFGVACNQGAAHADTEFLLFLNPDAALAPGALGRLLDAADTHPEAAAFVPRVLDGKGKPAFRRRSRLLPRSAHWSGPPPQGDAEVPLLNGAAIFVSRDHFAAVGGFDENIFLYHEDDDLSLRLASEFGPLRHVHDAIVTHAEGHGSARTPATAALKARHMAQSAIYAMRKHGQPFARPRIVGRALSQMLSPLNLLSARKRSKNLGFLRGAFDPLPANLARDD